MIGLQPHFVKTKSEEIALTEHEHKTDWEIPVQMRRITDQELSHERLGDSFRESLSDYDTQRRVDVLIHEFLNDEMVRGRAVLDVGCGLGFFSQALQRRGALVSAGDIGPGLVERTRQLAGCEARVADVMELAKSYPAQSMDVVVSSDCVEHVPDPRQAIAQMAAILKPGGYLSLSTPNRVWQPVVRAVTTLKLRPFDGHENFLS